MSSPPPSHAVPIDDEENEDLGRTHFSIIGWFFGLVVGFVRLIFLTVFVSLLVGGMGYYSIRKYVQGETATVPLLIDENAAEALQLLRDRGLYLELERKEFRDNKPAGLVVGQYPLPDSKVKKNSPVRVVVSDGPARVAMPDLRGLDYREAEMRLAEAELQRDKRSNLPSFGTPPNAVITTDPPPGAYVPRGSPVNLLVSSGPARVEIAMPRLTGRNEEEAKQLLSRLGLVIGEVREELQSPLADGTVVEQSPGAGVRLDAATPISVVVARNRRPGAVEKKDGAES